jgi:EpsI family protein
MGNEFVRLMLIAALLAVTVVGVRAGEEFHAARKPNYPQWGEIPHQLSDWRGRDAEFDPIYGPDVSDTNLLRVYENSQRQVVIAYVGYYRELTKILEVHSPEVCYPAQEWTIASTGKFTVGEYRGRTIRADQAVVEKAGSRRIVVWWYNAGGRPYENRIRFLWALPAYAAVTGRSDGSMVRFEAPFVAGEEDKARQALMDFQQSFLPVLDRALPR